MVKPLVCAVCHEEVRWGTRGGRLAWWHRDDQPDTTTGYVDKRVGHEPVLGHPSWESNLVTVDVEGTTKDGEEDDRIWVVPPPEVYAHPIDIDGDGLDAELMPGGARNLIKAVRQRGGRALATYSKGPRIHSSHGNLLEMSGYVVVKFERDGRRAVARWVNKAGKWELDCAYILHYCDHLIHPIPAVAAKGLDIRSWLLKWQGPLQEVDQ
jgi:hypothetical protein